MKMDYYCILFLFSTIWLMFGAPLSFYAVTLHLLLTKRGYIDNSSEISSYLESDTHENVFIHRHMCLYHESDSAINANIDFVDRDLGPSAESLGMTAQVLLRPSARQPGRAY